ncbi:polyketide synthase [Talaromyces pinophilus]|uniref:Polyketide synthase n=1 Tax=Talaromyces pinophilus TaxID=128442 RepID=A0A0B8N3Y6_TALPI|nr:polyketide synthase [Talaromyces pinophilus]
MIVEVGYLHENPEIEATLLRKCIQPLNEEEFVQVLDFGISAPGSDAEFVGGKFIGGELAHTLTGLESYGVHKLMAQGFEVHNGVIDETRTFIFAASLRVKKDEKAEEQDGNSGSLEAGALWFKELPPGTAPIFTPEASAPMVLDAMLRLTKKRFSNTILMQLDAVDEHVSLPSTGVDSMFAAEFRTCSQYTQG